MIQCTQFLHFHTPFETRFLPFHTPFEAKFLPFHTPKICMRETEKWSPPNKKKKNIAFLSLIWRLRNRFKEHLVFFSAWDDSRFPPPYSSPSSRLPTEGGRGFCYNSQAPRFVKELTSAAIEKERENLSSIEAFVSRLLKAETEDKTKETVFEFCCVWSE